MNKTKRGEGKRAMKKKKNLKSSSKAVTDQEIIDKFKLKGSDAIRVKNGKTKNK